MTSNSLKMKGRNRLRSDFQKAIDSPYKITYQTSVEGMDLVQKTYDNKATLYDGQTKESDVNAVVSIPNGEIHEQIRKSARESH